MDQSRVQSVFDSAASQYDLMNNLMSFGMHYHWKATCVDYCTVYPGDRVLDLAAGTGDITYYLKKKHHNQIHIIAADPNIPMLSRGRDTLLDYGMHENIEYCHCYAEALPFAKKFFNLVVCAFGFRNFSDKQAALAQIYNVLKPGGQILILEFSKARSSVMQSAYQLHSQYTIPAFCSASGANYKDYEYLIDSIAKHPDQQQVTDMITTAGFTNCHVINMLSGIVSIHKAIRPL